MADDINHLTDPEYLGLELTRRFWQCVSKLASMQQAGLDGESPVAGSVFADLRESMAENPEAFIQIFPHYLSALFVAIPELLAENNRLMLKLAGASSETLED